MKPKAGKSMKNDLKGRFITNSTRLEKLRLETDPIITNIVQGVSNEAFVSSLLLPDVTVTKRTGKYPVFGNKAMEVHNTDRALRSDEIKKMAPDIYTFDKFDCKPHALGYALDSEEVEAASDIISLEQYYTDVTMEALLLAKEAEACELLQSADSYASGHSDALSGTECWDNASSNPLTQIKDAILTVKGKNVKKPNILVLSPAAFAAISEHAALTDKIKYTQKAVVTEDIISSLISSSDNTIKVVVGTGMYYDVAQDKYINLWNNTAVLAYVTQTARSQRNKYESTFGYTFVRSGYPSGARESGKFGLTTELGVFHSYDMKICKNSAAFLFTNVAASPKG